MTGIDWANVWDMLW